MLYFLLFLLEFHQRQSSKARNDIALLRRSCVPAWCFGLERFDGHGLVFGWLVASEHEIRFLRQTTALSHSVELSVAGCWVDGYGVGLKVKPGIWNQFFTPEGRSCFVGIATETSPNLDS